MAFTPVRRIVTGHDDQGRAVVTEAGPVPNVVRLDHIPGTVFHEIWSTAATPALVGNGPDPTLGPLTLSPPANGTRIRIVDIPPDTEEFLQQGAARMRRAFEQIGEAAASTVSDDSPHPLMHRTESVDYGIVIEGELTLILDDAEVALRPGSVVVQRGTNHAWANRSQHTCRILFVLIDGAYDPAIAATLERH